MKILFIGNSYTYYNDMPKLFEAEFKKNGVCADVESITAGGYRLLQFLSDDDEYGRLVKKTLDQTRFDYVVLQEQSVYPVTETETFFKCVSELTALIKANGAKPVLYETWGRADGSEALTRLGLSHDEMQIKLKEAYEAAAKKTDAIPVYAGEKFHEAYRSGKAVFDPDGSHPSLLGSQIVAKEFYSTLF